MPVVPDTPDTPLDDGSERQPSRRDVVVGESQIEYTLYQPLRVGGSGAFGQLWTGQYTASDGSHPTVAIKILDPRPQSGPDAARREFARGRDRGPHVVPYRDHSRNGEQPAFVVMDYLPGSNLQQWVTTNGPLEAEELGALLTALASALERIYSDDDTERRSYHGDLAPKNVMRLGPTDDVPAPRYVVLDFGHGHRDDTVSPTSVVNPARYITPEANVPISALKTHLIYTDVHLAAQVIVYALTGEHPTTWGATDVDRDLTTIAAMVPATAPEPLRQLLGRMLEYDIAKRARLAQLAEVVAGLRVIAAGLSGASSHPDRSTLADPTPVTVIPDPPRSTIPQRIGAVLAWAAAGLVAGLVVARGLAPRLERWHLVPVGTDEPQEFVVATMLSWGALLMVAAASLLLRSRRRRRRRSPQA